MFTDFEISVSKNNGKYHVISQNFYGDRPDSRQPVELLSIKALNVTPYSSLLIVKNYDGTLDFYLPSISFEYISTKLCYQIFNDNHQKTLCAFNNIISYKCFNHIVAFKQYVSETHGTWNFFIPETFSWGLSQRKLNGRKKNIISLYFERGKNEPDFSIKCASTPPGTAIITLQEKKYLISAVPYRINDIGPQLSLVELTGKVSAIDNYFFEQEFSDGKISLMRYALYPEKWISRPDKTYPIFNSTVFGSFENIEISHDFYPDYFNIYLGKNSNGQILSFALIDNQGEVKYKFDFDTPIISLKFIKSEVLDNSSDVDIWEVISETDTKKLCIGTGNHIFSFYV